MRTNFYCSSNNVMFYFKTIISQQNLGRCLLDAFLSDRDYLTNLPHV